MAPLLISAAPNGARRTKADHHALPITAAELAQEALRCVRAGARLLHLHVRDPEGRHTLAPDIYRRAIAAIHAEVADELIVQVTTESCGAYTATEQMEIVRELGPEAASFALREFIAGPSEETLAADFFQWVHASNILAQFILYSPAEAERLRDLMRRGIIPHVQPSVLFVLGRTAQDAMADPGALIEFVATWGNSGPWSVCAFGPAELWAAAVAAALGGHVRVGFENNLLRPDGSPLAANAEQVANVARLAIGANRRLATARQARTLFQAPPERTTASIRSRTARP